MAGAAWNSVSCQVPRSNLCRGLWQSAADCLGLNYTPKVSVDRPSRDTIPLSSQPPLSLFVWIPLGKKCKYGLSVKGSYLILPYHVPRPFCPQPANYSFFPFWSEKAPKIYHSNLIIIEQICKVIPRFAGPGEGVGGGESANHLSSLYLRQRHFPVPGKHTN
jgi:hypothetical protein